MFSRCLSAALLFCAYAAIAAASPVVRICADPDNLPFSNRAGQGFDNRIATMVSRAMGRTPVFVWARSRRGFLREEFNRGACDMLIGVPERMRGVLTTRPYYRSSYVFVTPERTHARITSFNDPRLNRGRIGLQILEENYSPPSLPLIRNGHAGQLMGFESFGTQGADIVRAVCDGRVGTAVVWGPVAGYFTSSLGLPLVLTPVAPSVDSSGIPFAFAIAIAVHAKDADLRDRINDALAGVRPDIDAILSAYHVPLPPIVEAKR
jgi:mxaJ protein